MLSIRTASRRARLPQGERRISSTFGGISARKRGTERTRLMADAAAALLLSAVLAMGGCAGAPAASAEVQQEMSSQAATTAETSVAPTEDTLSIGDFATQNLDGEEVTQEIFAGAKLSLVNVWATWCGPCLQELPGLESISVSESRPDFQVIGIVHDLYDPATGQVDGEAMEAADLIKGRLSLTFPNLIPDEALYDGILSTLYAFPTTFFVDADGNVVGDPIVGSQSEADWQKTIAAKMQEAGL